MSGIKQIGRVMSPSSDQDASIAFYTGVLGFTLVADIPFAEGDRWVEVAPPGGGASVAFVPPRGEFSVGRMTGITFTTDDARALREELAARGVDVDAELMGGDGVVPAMFFFRDNDGNHLLAVEG